MHKNTAIKSMFDEIIARIQEAGIIEHLIKSYSGPVEFDTNLPLEPFYLEQFLGAYFILAIGCILAFIAFFCEKRIGKKQLL